MSSPTPLPNWFLVSRSEDQAGNVIYEQLPADGRTNKPSLVYSPQIVSERDVIRAVAGGMVYFTAFDSRIPGVRWEVGAQVLAQLTTAKDATTGNNLLSLPDVGVIVIGNDSSGLPRR